ncbi:type II toxin-antitoxin system PemK/MazF family toxin [Halobacterium sp. KA-4]|uniref:type II toxin-antitoxin system PemK/MazF family toxin n=1 Tax=Halobacterium sp. KA-4 TaxID=2896367 RepID=UPI001E5F7AEC|nr:type II toxin-antitoxin system PemK/MazF family toxin [Halobacterium sp. KA-4]MCD2201042.1 type II toxin-antitoxin system PemK/MazF family toxin [Halobacterium sp. KA-4]
MNIQRGDIVQVDLGGKHDDDTRGSEIYKPRRSVVIQNDMGNQNAPTTIIAPISDGYTGYPFHVNLPGSMPELKKDSHIQLDQIRTVDIGARITKKYGSLSQSQMEAVDEAIRISLGLR